MQIGNWQSLKKFTGIKETQMFVASILSIIYVYQNEDFQLQTDDIFSTIYYKYK